ncbi:MAG: 6-carboxytetrahydropterin synthase, partial [Desulfotomaculum sp.]|nr:6-carboxytetrahydropterin synthase [Desulfotomaculum sp.]
LVAQATGGLDHSYINELAPFTPDGPEGNPTAENLSRYIYKQVKKELANGEYGVKMLKVRLWESPNAAVTYWEE